MQPIDARSRSRRRIVGLSLLAAVLAAVVASVVAQQALAHVAPRLPMLGIVAAGPASSPGVEDGLLPDGPVGPDSGVPAIANLDVELLAAVRLAAADAEASGIVLVVNSGWRSEALQQQMLDDAIVTYGSEEEAARWVSTPEESAHVTGDAVDVGGWDAAAWLAERGAAYGLCQTYANESWHFELRVEAPARGCPEMLEDPTHAH